MLTPRIIHFSGVFCILAWVLVSGYYWFSDNGDYFQRMGALGVAVAVAYFAFVKHAVGAPAGYYEYTSSVTRSLDYMNRSSVSALANLAILASVLKDDFERQGKAVPPQILGISNTLPSVLPMVEDDLINLPEQLDEQMKNGLNLQNKRDIGIEKSKFRSDMLQMIVLFVATLQWGFGDLFFTKGCVQC